MFRYRFKSIIKDKGLIFWTLCFPMILSLFFNFALRDIYMAESVNTQEVAVVVQDNPDAQMFLDTLETDYELIKQHPYSSYDEAILALEAGSVDSIINYDSNFKVTATKDTMMLSILNNVFNTYNTKQAIIQEVIQRDPSKVTPEFLNNLVNTQSFIENQAEDKANNAFAIHFYTTVAMLCIYAANWGQKSAEYLQADASALGIRTNISPTSKIKLVLIDISVVFLIFMIEYAIHISFLKYILNAPFGNNTLLLIAIGIGGGLVSITMGYAISLFVTGSSDQHSMLISGLGVFSSFLSGMMSVEIKTFSESIMPFIRYTNPATLITDSFRYLTLPGYESKILFNISIMLGMSLLFAIIAYQKLKVVSYDSI